MTPLEKEQKLIEIIDGYGPCALAFSGGVDSTYLLDVANEALSGMLLAISAISPAFPQSERTEAEKFCESLGIRHIVFEGGELELPQYRQNPPQRCYICKKHLFSNMLEKAASEGYRILMEGTNASDSGDYRPGARALRELGIKSPLREAGLSKDEIRERSKARGLATWEKPSMACLATRIPYGQTITPEKLSMIGQAEDFLHEMGAAQCRVRLHADNLARIEVLPEDITRLADPKLRQRISDRFTEIGFLYTAIDIKGYYTGSMNRGINIDEKSVS